MTTPPPPLPVPDTSTATIDALTRDIRGLVLEHRRSGWLDDVAEIGRELAEKAELMCDVLREVLASRDALAAREARVRTALDVIVLEAKTIATELLTDTEHRERQIGRAQGRFRAHNLIADALLDAPVSSAPTSTEAGP